MYPVVKLLYKYSTCYLGGTAFFIVALGQIYSTVVFVVLKC